MLFDTHMHCEESCDSKMKAGEAVAQGAKLGIGICVTEHLDYDYPTNGEKFVFNLSRYRERMQPLRGAQVLFGIEIGMQPHLPERNRVAALSQPFDYVLCSIHCVRGYDIFGPDYYRRRPKNEVVREYLAEMLVCVQNHQEIDALAHIDYIARYWPYGEELLLGDAPDLWDRVFKVLIERNIPLEINTRRLAAASTQKALAEIYSRYQELGGKYVTLGSDAHYIEHVGRDLKLAYDLAKNCHLQPVYFRERQLQKF